jgi:hypothetical protein
MRPSSRNGYCGDRVQFNTEDYSMLSSMARNSTGNIPSGRPLGLLALGILLTCGVADRSLAQEIWQRDIGKLDKALIGNWQRGGPPARRSPIGAHHGILINDVHVQPASNDEPASPCREKECGRASSDCDACQHGKCQRHSAATAGDQPSSAHADETAQAVLEIMDALGRSVIAGTEFEPATAAVPEELPAPLSEPSEIRAALVKYLHALQAQHAAEVAATGGDDDGRIWVHDVATEVAVEAHPNDAVAALRESSTSLEAAASQLEALELYDRADQVRSLAQELRHDARRMKTGGVAHMRRHAAPVVEATRGDDEPCDHEATRHRLRLMREAMRHEPSE